MNRHLQAKLLDAPQKKIGIKNVFVGVDEPNVAACLTRSRMIPTKAARQRSCLPAQTMQCVCVCVDSDNGGKDNDGDRVGANQNNMSFRRIQKSPLTNVFVRCVFLCPFSLEYHHLLVFFMP